MLSLEDALERMLDGVEPLPAEQAELEEALDRVLAAPLSSRLTLPPWDNSAMDGFAVRAADVEGASQENARVLEVVGEAAAGHQPTAAVEPGTAVRILTGAPLPLGADAIVPVEETDAPIGSAALGSRVSIYRPAARGTHIRRAGSDLRAGYPLAAAGQQAVPALLAVAAAGGHGSLSVHARPRVAVLATGDELAPPGAQLGPAQIPDSNSVGLLGQALEIGAQARSLGICGDRLDEVLDRLGSALAWADVIVASGGVSVGAHDVVKDAFAGLGRVDLWRVAVQPGKPLAFGRAHRPEGAAGRRGDVLLFGLPGNPVSSFVTFELFVRPVLRRLAGHADLSGRELVRARLTEPVSKGHARRAFLRVRLGRDGQGGLWEASLAGGQGSHVLSALVAAEGLAIVHEDVDELPAGAMVDVIRLRTGADA
jgi:molybdopterin molybdotransferase